MNGWLTSFSLTLKLHGQGHGCGQRARSYNRPSIIVNSLPFHFTSIRPNNSGDRAISKFDLETSKVKVMSEVKSQGHILYPVSNQCTSFSFHINQTNHSLKFVPKIRLNNIPALVQIMTWRLPGTKPLSEPRMTWFTDAYMRHSASLN